jgi:inorganic pyrophosphatase
MLKMAEDFWDVADRFIAENTIIIDRPAGSAHPRYTEFIYPLDYGYLEGTTASDGDGIDLWAGSLEDDPARCTAAICTLDPLNKDAEIKLLINCTEDEIQTALRIHNSGPMQGLLIRRKR